MEDLCACPSYFHSKAILHVCSLTLHEREFLPFSSNHLLISSSSEIEILRACLEQRLFHILKEFMHVKRHKINCIKLFSLLLITQLLLLVIDGYLIFGLSSNVGRLKWLLNCYIGELPVVMKKFFIQKNSPMFILKN